MGPAYQLNAAPPRMGFAVLNASYAPVAAQKRVARIDRKRNPRMMPLRRPSGGSAGTRLLDGRYLTVEGHRQVAAALLRSIRWRGDLGGTV